MRQKLFSGNGFYIGQMFREAATRHGAVPVVLDRPLDVAPDAGLNHTYRSLADLVDRLADQLWTAGVRPASHVAIHKRDNADIALLACAVSLIGAVPVLLSPGLDATAAGILLSRLDRPLLVTDDVTLERLAHTDIAGLTSKRVLVTGVFPGAVTLDGLEVAGRAKPVRLHPEEPAMITHSSGTTDVPKLAVHCARALWNRLVPQKIMAVPLRGETAAFCMSFVHSRFYHALGTFLSGGSRLLLLVDHEPASVGPLLARWQPGVVETHPNTFVLWEDLADAPGAPLRNVRCFGSTFDAIHPRTVQRLLGASRRRGKYLMQLYGQSETGPVAARVFTARGAARGNGRLVGIGLPGFTRVRITDDAGVPVPSGTVGHIEAHTRGRILTYQGAQDRFDAQLNGRWWRMGDMGSRSWWGGLHLIDREIDRIDDVDSNLRIEDVLMSRLDELREVVVVPGADGVAVPVVCTRTGAPLAPTRWERATADLPALAAPLQWAFDDLPRTSTWKIKRVTLARLIAAGDGAVAHA
ncbi:class I adenylate-forming enzyme family protein [Lentzea nigeriaca]|uniref:class I adenylate-forming enzyme family protein n=1 Tax=Lentzea nigeriaca TaxID=1128665 RepID=UPI0027DC02F5|nr:class I adenylate-forming enzyme family protein [Lentzea nigeriaca]MBM7863239.1 fatty acid CoA ligase FadD22 [Lentzea nigeriaca]